MQETRHIPVLLQSVFEALQLQPGMTVVDATFGGGGHAVRILEAVGKKGRVIGIDRDQKAIERFREHHVQPENLQLIHGNYSDIETILHRVGIQAVDGIVADLGFSSDQIEEGERGMAFSKTGPLDMRMDQSFGITAKEILETASQEELETLLVEHGEERDAKRISRALVERRATQPFETTTELAEFLKALLPKRASSGIPSHMAGRHPATKTFQALRIAVNQEKEHLVRFLESTVDILKPGGRLAVITFHSGEDRIVKHFFREASRDCICPKEFPVCQCDHPARLKVVTPQPRKASPAEVEANPRARSAKLRVAEKL